MADETTATPPETSEEVKSTPIFGSASTFGAGTGFGGFTGLASAPKAEDGEDADGDEADAPEEECAAEFKPIVQLDEVDVKTGEEEEECLFDAKCKLYRFDNDSGEWKERGVGQGRLLQHKETNLIRFLMRQDKTLKIRANHIVIPGTKVQEHSGSEKAMVWSCVDFADEVQRPELFCLRFASPERAQEFKKSYEECCEKNADKIPQPAEGEGEKKGEGPSAADELAAQVESVKVEDDKKEEEAKADE